MRALLDILEFDLKIDYLSGARNYIQDALIQEPNYKDSLIISRIELPSRFLNSLILL
jgi:hypothetical protein